MPTHFVVVSEETPAFHDFKVFGIEGHAHRHAQTCLKQGMNTSIYKVEADDARAAVAAVEQGDADLILSQPGDPSPQEVAKREREHLLAKQKEFLRDLGYDSA